MTPFLGVGRIGARWQYGTFLRRLALCAMKTMSGRPYRS
jgi:hypothetical protein